MGVSSYYPERSGKRRAALPSGYDARPSSGSDGIDIGEFLHILRSRLFTMLLTFVIVVGLALLYLFIAPSQYQASTMLLIDPRLGRGLGSDPAQSNFASDTSAMDSQVKLLASQAVLSRVVKNENLTTDPEFGNGGGGGGLLSKLGLSSPKKADGDELSPVLKSLSEAITIKRPERTYVVEIQAASKDPVKAASLANAVARAYIEDQVESRVEAAESDSKWVRVRVANLQTQIQAAENKVEAYKSANRIVSTDGLRSSEQQVADLTKELGFARARASEAKAKLDQVQRVAREGRNDASNEALKSATIERLRSQQADIEREISKLGNTLGPRHPAFLEAQAQQQKIRRLIGEELQRVAAGTANEYQVAHNNELALERDIEKLKGQSNTSSKNLVPLRQLERDVEALRASYDRFSKIQDGLSQQESDSPPARVVAAARPPISPSSPKRMAILFLALAAGIFAALAAALVQEGLVRRRAKIAAGNPESEPPQPRRAYDDEDRPQRRRATDNEGDGRDADTSLARAMARERMREREARAQDAEDERAWRRARAMRRRDRDEYDDDPRQTRR